MAPRDPWEVGPGAAADPWETPAASPDVLHDVGRSAAGGLLRAPLHVAGAAGDIRAAGEAVGRQLFGADYERRTRAWEADPRNQSWLQRLLAGAPTTMDIAGKIERASGLPATATGETLPGRLVGGAVETAADPLSLALGPGGVVARVGTGAAAGTAGAAGQEVAGPIGGLVGGTVGSLIPGSIVARSATRAAQQASAPTAASVRAGPPPGTRRTMQSVVADEAAARLSERLDTAVDQATRRAQAHGGNVANNLRDELNAIIDEGGLVPEHEAALRKIVASGRWLQAMSHYAHWGHSPFALMLALTHHPEAAIGTLLGTVATRAVPRWLDRRFRVGAVERLSEEALRAAPSGGGPVSRPWLVTPAPAQLPIGVVRALSPSLQDLSEQNDGR